MAATLAFLFASARPAHAGPFGNDPFLLLQKGIYQPVTNAPNLGLVGVNLNRLELIIPEATGIYKSFIGGHNHMVDRAHVLTRGAFDENCICMISLPSALPLWWPPH